MGCFVHIATYTSIIGKSRVLVPDYWVVGGIGLLVILGCWW